MAIEMLKSLLRKMALKLAAPDRYRPERHYMRGPGPKSKQRAEHSGETERSNIQRA